MSRSPAKHEALAADDEYLQWWGALTLLLLQGHSFSGHEQNCCFLNTGQRRFADVSSVTGLDFMDDGRGLGLVDWDHDGDLDLWITNRTAPRVRLLRNDVPKAGAFIAIRLEGRQCNRDAVGARVKLTVAGPGAMTMVRTVRAGEGFASQSSKWIHFGLGKNGSVSRLTVRWPAGKTEEFTDLTANRRYTIVQGDGRATALSDAPRQLSLKHSTVKRSVPALPARSALTSRRPFPRSSYSDFSGRAHRFTEHEGPVLVNLWANWCQPCLKELAEFASHYDQLKRAGLTVLALSTDSLSDDASDQQAAAQIVSRSAWPFSTGLASRDLVDQLTKWHDQTFFVRHDLPIPTSFLVDAQGRIAVIYKGPVSVEQLLADVKLLDLPNDELFAAALPFAGRRGIDPKSIHMLAFAQTFLEGEYYDDAKQVIKRYLEFVNRRRERGTMSHDVSRQELIRALRLLAATEQAADDWESAVDAWRQVVQLDPVSLRYEYYLAVALVKNGQVREGISYLEHVLERKPDMHAASNNLAWILSTNPMDSIRDGRRALELVEAASRAVGSAEPSYLDTLAAAQAEVGQFDDAVATAQKALQRLRQAGRNEEAESLADRLEQYRIGRPYRAD